MWRLKASIIWLMACSLLPLNQAESYCARCEKIEAERAEEQAKHPPPKHYFEDHNRVNDPLAENSAPERSRHETEFFEDDEVKKQDQARSDQKPAKMDSQDIQHVITSAYSTLLTLFKTKDFLETLDGSFTLMLPTNEALQKLGFEKLHDLLQPENSENLSKLVSNHIIPQKLLKKDFEKFNNKEIKALSGRNLTLSIHDGIMSIARAKILLIEPAGYDGVIYVIDRVLE